MSFCYERDNSLGYYCDSGPYKDIEWKNLISISLFSLLYGNFGLLKMTFNLNANPTK